MQEKAGTAVLQLYSVAMQELLGEAEFLKWKVIAFMELFFPCFCGLLFWVIFHTILAMNRDSFKSVPLNSGCISLSYPFLRAFGSWVLLKCITGCSPSCVLLGSANDIPSQYCIIQKGKRWKGWMEQISVNFCLERMEFYQLLGLVFFWVFISRCISVRAQTLN